MANKLWVNITGNITDGSRFYVYNGLPIQVIYQELQPDLNFEDLTSSITGWDTYGSFIFDFSQVRNVLWDLVLAIVQPDYSHWNDLSDDEKKVACKYILAPYAIRITVVSDEQDKLNWYNTTELTQGDPIDTLQGRKRVYQSMRLFVSNFIRTETVSLMDGQDFYETVYLFTQYFVNANSPRLKWWLNNQPPYQNNGFQQKSYFNQAMLDGLNTILNDYPN